jgi:hypothetical protein
VQDPGSLDIIRQAGAVPKLLAMLSIANHGINGYYIPTAVTKAVQCLTAISRDNEANRRAVLNSSNFYAVEALRMRELVTPSFSPSSVTQSSCVLTYHTDTRS